MHTQINVMLILILAGTGIIAFALWLELIIEVIERIIKLIAFVLSILFFPIKYFYILVRRKYV